MDDAIDEMLAAARAIDLYELQQLRPEMKDIVALIAEAARVTMKRCRCSATSAGNGNQLHDLTERLVQPGRQGGRHSRGRPEARIPGDRAARPAAVRRRRAKFCRHLEKVTDAFEDVANQIDGIVIDHA